MKKRTWQVFYGIYVNWVSELLNSNIINILVYYNLIAKILANIQFLNKIEGQGRWHKKSPTYLLLQLHC